MAKPNPYLLMLGATITGMRTLRATPISVTLNIVPVRSITLLFPNSQFIDGGKGNLWATKWIIDRKNVELKKKGEIGGIRIDPERALFI